MTMLPVKRLGGWVAALLFAAAPPNDLSAENRLVDAVKNVDKAAIRALLNQHADVNLPEADGTTPLYWAVERDDLETAELLIRAGANAKAASRYGVTPLSLAGFRGSPAMIERLLKAGADPNAATPDGETALMTAARTGSAAAIRVLLAHGAEVNAKDGFRGQTALMWAAGEGHADAIKVLIEGGADIKARSTAGWTPLLFAAREGQLDAVRVLLDAGANPSEALQPPNRQNAPVAQSALLLAVGSNHYALAAYLLDRGADPNAAGLGFTALHQISWMRKPGQGGNGPGPTGSGDMDSLELVKRLVAHGANVNARMTRQAPRRQIGSNDLNTKGATPFMMAARTADAPLMRLLAALGADPLLTNDDKTTPLMVAAGLGTYSPGEDPGTDSEGLEAVKVALALGNDVNAVNKEGDTAMHGAAYKQFPSVVRFLAENGAKIDIWNTKNQLGWTPLRIAEGVFRGDNFRFSPPTAAALRQVMSAEGVSTVVEPEPEGERGIAEAEQRRLRDEAIAREEALAKQP
jgi:uncharacterized protein